MFINQRLIFVCLLIFLSAFKVAAQNTLFDTIASRIYTDLHYQVNDETLAHKIATNFTLLSADGTWIDIDYKDAKQEPLHRIKEMTMAYVRPKNQHYHSEKTYLLLVQSLQNWVDRNPKNKNWWYNDIFYPQAIGQILILLAQNHKSLPTDLQTSLIQRMQRKMRTNDGANTSDIALHYLYRACITKNKLTLDSATTFLYQPIAINNDKEGIQIDGSYYQHGKQQAIGSYGRVFVANAVNASFYLRNTAFALPQNQLNILIDFLKNTFSKTIRGSFYDFNVRGRGISRKDSLMSGMANLVNKIQVINAENKAYWQALALRTTHQKPADYQIIPSHTVFWKTGYTLHVSPAYTFSVQTASARTLRTERGNNENILGKFLADGANNIQLKGNEYANIMPIWEWDKIPGTTSRDYPNDEGATIKGDWGIPGTSDFVGGLSDGVFGVSAYHLKNDSVEAKKAWFFFDKEIVCLGAGINSNATQPIVTTLNQAWLNGKIFNLAKNQVKVLPENSQNTSQNLTAVMHDSVGYFFPIHQNLAISNQNQTGSWYRINNFQATNKVDGKVFKMWLEHGQKPINAAYQYIVVPGLENLAELKNYPIANLQVLKNTAEIQAVEHKGLDVMQIVFYQPSAFETNNFSIKVDKACVVEIKNFSSKNAILFIADPAQQHSTIEVVLKLPQYSSRNKITYALPNPELAGKTFTYPLK